MAIALVKLGTVATGTTSVSPTFGQATGSGNLLIAWVAGPLTGAVFMDANTPSGWTRVADSGITAHIFYKANSSASATAPTFSGDVGESFMVAALAEFSGAATSTPLDLFKKGSGTTSPQVVANASADAAGGELVVSIALSVYSMAATKTTSDTYNNGATATNVGNNDATSTVNHYRISYGITTGNASATQDSYAFTTTNISANNIELATFKLPGGAPPAVIPDLTMGPLAHA